MLHTEYDELAGAIARSYSHFFVFPQYFMPLVIACALPAARHLYQLPGLTWRWLLFGSVGAAAAVGSFLTAAELKEPPAIFEIAPAALAQASIGGRSLPAYFRDEPAVPHSLTNRQRYREHLQALLPSAPSMTRPWYLRSFFTQCTVLLWIFFLCAIYSAYTSTRNEAASDHPLSVTSNLLWAAVSIATLWIPMRIANERFTGTLYDLAPNANRWLIALALFIVGLLFLLTMIWAKLGDKLQATAGAVCSVVVAAFSVHPNAPDTLFGRKSSPSTPAMILVLILVICLALAAHLAAKRFGRIVPGPPRVRPRLRLP